MTKSAVISDGHTIGRLKTHQARRKDGSLTKTLRAIACERMDQIDAELTAPATADVPVEQRPETD